MVPQQEKDTNETIGSLITGNLPNSSETMDAKRTTSTLRDFLMKLDQAREWICTVTKSSMDITTFKEELPKAELLGRVVQEFDPSFATKIYISETREFRHTDNIMLFINWCKKIKLRKHFLFETVDLYESKNIPRVIYCIHGLAQFLNKRGLGKGIVVKKDVVFSYAENSLFAEDLENISMQRFDEIQNRLDSEDSVEYIPKGDNNSNNSTVLRTFVKGFSWRASFLSLIYGIKPISVQSLRKFIDFDLNGETRINAISDLQSEIVDLFKQNGKKEEEKDELLYSIRLLHENIDKLRNIPISVYPLANDFKYLKKAIYRLIHDYKLCFEIINGGYELPLRTLFPDNFIGDFHFSKFLSLNLKKNPEKIIELARSHFISSKVFKSIVEAYSTNLIFDMNPISVRDYLVEKDIGRTRKTLIDEAIDSKAVRDEIQRRAQSIIGFITSKFNYLINTDLPYYIKIFIGEPFFYSYFIEPAIYSSGNFIIAELMNYIFSSGDDSFVQERLCRDSANSTFIKTNSFDFSDFSPLKEFLDSSRIIFNKELEGIQLKVKDVDDYFIQNASVGDLLQIETTVEEINNIALILKDNQHLMSNEMIYLVNKIDSSSISNFNNKISVYSQLGTVRIEYPIQSNGEVELSEINGEVGFNRPDVMEKIKDIEYKESDNRSNSNTNRSNSNINISNKSVGNERFILLLDNQYSLELDQESGIAINALLRDLKYKTMTLIYLSESKSLDSILNDPNNSEDITLLQESVKSSISLLKKKDVFKSKDYEYEILQMIASDILNCKYNLLNKEVNMNIETSDALFHKGALLDKYIDNLYNYLGAFTESMFVNKSGIFFNTEAQPYSKYGTYLIPLERFRAQVYEDIDIKDIKVKLICKEPMLIRMIIYLKDYFLAKIKEIRFDDLLKLREEGVLCFDMGDVCSASVGSMIEIINEKYVNY